MNSHYLMTVFSALLCSASLRAAEKEGFFDGGWRISAGAVWSSPVRAKLGFAPPSMRPAGRTTSHVGLDERAAQAQAEGGTYDSTTGRTTYPNDSWFAPDDGVEGGGRTWNAWIPASAYRNDRTFSLGRTSYDGTTVDYVPEGHPRCDASDSSGLFGIDVELSRELYRNDEDKYGLDLAFGVMYFFKRNVFKADGAYRAGHEETTVSGGSYEGTIAAPDELPDSGDWYWNDDGSYGRGGIDTAYNGGPVFDLGSVSSVRHANADSTSGRDCFGVLSARGDYRELDLVLSLRPYYDVADWLRLYGTIGAVVSHDEFFLNLAASDGGRGFRHAAKSSQWDVHGIGGLGVMLRYKDFTLAGDFLARFLDDDLSVDDRYVHGTVEHSRWMFKLTLGYEF